jgi:membrane protein involved in colicin uptake
LCKQQHAEKQKLKRAQVRAAAESGDAASMAKLKAEAERKAAARKAEAERKAAARKAEAERKAAAQKAEAERKAAAQKMEAASCDAWFELSDCGGGVVGGQQYTSTQCVVQALMIDDQHVLAWLNLGMLMAEQITGDTGGGLVAGQQHSSAQ